MGVARRRRPGTRAPARRRAGVVMLLLVLALSLVGCSAGNSQPEPPSQKEVQKLQDKYAKKSYKAMRTRDQKLITSIESGDLLDRDIANMKLSDRLSEPKKAEEFTYPHSKGYAIKQTTGDQQRLLTVADYSNAKHDWKNLGLYTRNGPAAPRKRTFTGGLYASDVPDFTTENDHLVPLAPDASGYAALPNSMPGLVARALQHPGGRSAESFQSSQVRQRYADELATNKKRASEVGTVTRKYRPGNFLTAVQTDGGYLVLGSFTFTETTTARSGKSITFKSKSAQHTLYPGKYRKTTSSYGAMFAAVVPKHGKITLVSGEERQTGLSAKK